MQIKPHHSTPLSLRLYSHNIRYDNKSPVEGEKLWHERRQLVCSSIQFNTAIGDSIVSLQEVLHNQLVDILGSLNKENDTWSYYGIGREDGYEKGEYAPILYNHKTWELVESDTFWLSETPEKPSVGWDAALERIVTYVHLKHKQSGHKVNVFNTHLDHQGIVARRESVKLILSKTANINKYPSFFSGDFNTEPTDEPYQIVSQTLSDTRKIDKSKLYGHTTTFTSFAGEEKAKIIDYIWVPPHNVHVVNFGVLHSEFEFFMSDHRPIVADLLVL